MVMTNVLVTGGAGFIGSNFVRHALAAHPDWRVTTLDKLTYAGRLENLKGAIDHPRHEFVKGDVADPAVAAPLVTAADIVVHFAAETHVDRSIMNAGEFITTDVFGTFVLLEAAREAPRLRKFVQISTDEVYGSIPEGSSTETDELRPRNPYSASKAGADRLAYSYWATYQVPVVITRASNNYGPNQFPEKIIPLFITNAIDDRQVPLYGDGMNVRDWLHVSDNCRALDLIIEAGAPGEVYNVGGGNHVKNVDLTRRILRLLDKPDSLIRAVADRAGHDRRYSVDTAKLHALGWTPRVAFEQGLAETVSWYRQNEWWWRPIKEGDPAFQAYYKTQYSDRRG
jgi:dTDP-glucose 4,6-dehydratase